MLNKLKNCLKIYKTYNELFSHLSWDETAIQKYQLEQLKQRLIDAKKVPLYQNRNLPDINDIQTLSDWQNIPVLTKQDILSGKCADYYLNPEYKKDDLFISKSSGSTGVALDVYYDTESAFLFSLAMLRIYNMVFSYKPWHNHTYVYTSPFKYKSLFGFFKMDFISTLTPIPVTLDIIRKQRPAILTCYPSHLRAIVDEMTDHDFTIIKPKIINVNSEMSSQAERNALAKKLNAFVFDDYSSEELLRIASQCREYHYHIFDDINYMEILDDNYHPLPEGVVGNIVGSNLHNRAMPFLRYLQGDRGSIRTIDCPCGKKTRVLEKLEGRKNDAFVLPDGKIISSGFLLDLTYNVLLKYSIQSYCLIQETINNWVLEVVPGKDWNDMIAKNILGKLTQDLNQPEVNLDLKIVSEIKKTASGKLNHIISRVNK